MIPPSRATERVKRHIHQRFDAMRIAQGKARIVEKTPRLILELKDSGKLVAATMEAAANDAEHGFEHSVANMYFVPAGLFIGDEIGSMPEGLGWQAFFLKNLLPVTIGNILGGSVLVGAVYWLAYLRGRTSD